MALLPRILFGLLFLGAFAGANVFVYRRTVHDTVNSPWVRRAMGLVLVLLFLAVPVLRFAFRETLPPQDLTTAVLFGWGVFLYTLMALMIVEAVKWVQRRRVKKPAADAAPAPAENPERRLFLSRIAASGALAVGTGAGVFGTWRAFNPPEVTEVPIKLRGLPKALDGFTIVQLSDVHVGAIIQEKFLDQLVATANGAKPDLIALTGDLVDGTPDQVGRYVARLRNLQSRFGTYFVSGNHDYYSGWEEWARELEGIDFEVLRNRTVSIGDPGASFDLVGVDDWGALVTQRVRPRRGDCGSRSRPRVGVDVPPAQGRRGSRAEEARPSALGAHARRADLPGQHHRRRHLGRAQCGAVAVRGHVPLHLTRVRLRRASDATGCTARGREDHPRRELTAVAAADDEWRKSPRPLGGEG